MRVVTASLCAALLLVACGGKKDDKKKDPKTGANFTSEAVKDNTPPKAALSKEQMLQKLWADPKNLDNAKSLLSFKADGTFSYFVFDGKAWKDYPSSYKMEGDNLNDLGDKQTYVLKVSETKLTLDNPDKDKQDFIDWIPATSKDCDAAATPPCPATITPSAPAPATPAK
jgi:major membrane immunogen (membrane-anchored lipoprotein)